MLCFFFKVTVQFHCCLFSDFNLVHFTRHPRNNYSPNQLLFFDKLPLSCLHFLAVSYFFLMLQCFIIWAGSLTEKGFCLTPQINVRCNKKYLRQAHGTGNLVCVGLSLYSKMCFCSVRKTYLYLKLFVSVTLYNLQN